MRVQILGALIVAGLLAGCGSAGTGASPAAPATSAPSAATAAPDATAAPTAVPAATAAPATPTAPDATAAESATAAPGAGSDGSTSEAIETPQAGGSEMVLDMSKQDLAQRLGVEASTITAQTVEEVEWNDSSLGCPQPGMAYMQVITPGYRIVLESQGTVYEYHTDANGRVVLCENTGSSRLPVSATRQP